MANDTESNTTIYYSDCLLACAADETKLWLVRLRNSAEILVLGRHLCT